MSNDPVFQLGEYLVIAHAAAQRQLLLQAVSEGATALDLSAVAEFDTSGVQLLLSARKTAQALGSPLELRNASAPVRELLDRYGLVGLLTDPTPSQGARP